VTVQIRKAYADTSGGQIHLRHTGSGGTPIVMLQQTASSSQMYERLMGALGADLWCIAFDTPGFGGSFDPVGNPSISDYASWICEAVDAVGLSAYHLFGHHTGACIGVEIAVADPQRVASLMMCGPAPLTADEREAFSQHFGDPIAPTADGSYLQETWEYLRSLGADRELALHHREMVDTLRAWQGRAMAYRAVWEQDWTATYERVSCPMFLLCAEDDVLYPYFERAKQLRPEAKAVTIAGANFEPDLDTDAVARAIRDFLAGE
jgi:pimeloyl-ACP methyl ester carboxylesterase